MIMKKNIITILFALVTMVGQAQVPLESVKELTMKSKYFNPNRSLGPILFSYIKILCCPPQSQECLSLVHVSHET